MADVDGTRVNAFTGNAQILAARVVRVFFVHEERNEWGNWKGDTQKTLRTARSVNSTLDDATARAESRRKPGTSFTIQETLALALDCDTGVALIHESASKVPMRGVENELKNVLGKRSLRQWSKTLASLSAKKFMNVDFFKKNERITFLSFKQGGQFYERRSSAGNNGSLLAWSLKQTSVDSGPIVSLAASINAAIALPEIGAIKLLSPQSVASTSGGSEARDETPSNVAFNSNPGLLSVAGNKLSDASNARQAASTTREQIALARVGQGLYRSRLELIEMRCRLTGLEAKKHLRASHIKPWRRCDDLERLDGNNGLLLSPHVDHLFDQGYLSFSDEGDVLVSSALDPLVLKLWRIDVGLNVGNFSPVQKLYLAYHRMNIFRS